MNRKEIYNPPCGFSPNNCPPACPLYEVMKIRVAEHKLHSSDQNMEETAKRIKGTNNERLPGDKGNEAYETISRLCIHQ